MNPNVESVFEASLYLSEERKRTCNIYFYEQIVISIFIYPPVEMSENVNVKWSFIAKCPKTFYTNSESRHNVSLGNLSRLLKRLIC